MLAGRSCEDHLRAEELQGLVKHSPVTGEVKVPTVSRINWKPTDKFLVAAVELSLAVPDQSPRDTIEGDDLEAATNERELP